MKRRILVVDDEAAIRLAVDEFFTLQGYSVRSARDPEEARACLAVGRFQLIIADLQMSGASAAGFDLLGHVHASHPATRIIVLTASGGSDIENRARRCGADLFLHKPQPLPKIAEEVERLLAPVVP